MRLRHPIGIGISLAFLAAGSAHARELAVTNTAALQAAVQSARPGDQIVLADGVYRLADGIECANPGTPAAPIVVRAAHPFGARILSATVEAFHVLAPNWHFRDLEVRGVCADDSTCEHAFHVVGHATGFQMVHNRVVDFNAQLKVNADMAHNVPDGGLVEDNEIFDTHPRHTANPVAPLNIDIASDWIVRRNVIANFYRTEDDQVSYGAFVKGGAQRPVFEDNFVLCAPERPSPGVRVGLSFGDGGMDAALCAPAWNAAVPCDPEVRDGSMRNNIVVNCSDVGIYLNKAANTRLVYNTLIGTAGIDFRYPSSTGLVAGNVLSGGIHRREGGSFTGRDNLLDVPLAQFAAWYRDPWRGDLRAKGDLGALIGKGAPVPEVTADYCGRPRRGARLDLGALQASLGDCPTAPALPWRTEAGH
jgi:parallel beta-helix repeat protein